MSGRIRAEDLRNVGFGPEVSRVQGLVGTGRSPGTMARVSSLVCIRAQTSNDIKRTPTKREASMDVHKTYCVSTTGRGLAFTFLSACVGISGWLFPKIARASFFRTGDAVVSLSRSLLISFIFSSEIILARVWVILRERGSTRGGGLGNQGTHMAVRINSDKEGRAGQFEEAV